MEPRVSVIMPTFNRKEYLGETIESVLGQTYKNFEFVIVDDGSTDGSLEIIKKIQKKDPRIRLVLNKNDKGIVEALNLAIRESQGEYIARIDSDDVCLPERLEKQVAFMDKNPDIGACGSWVKLIGNTEEKILETPKNHNEIKNRFFFFGGAIANPTSMVRKSLITEKNLWYDPYFFVAEDYDFWVRATDKIKVANIPEVLLLYRFHDTNTMNFFTAEREKRHKIIWTRELNKLSINPTKSELETHKQFALGRPAGIGSEVRKIKSWADKVIAANKKNRVFDRKTFSRLVEQKRIELITPYLQNRNRILIKYWLNKVLGTGGQALRIFLPGKTVDKFRGDLFKIYKALIKIYIKIERGLGRNNAKMDRWYILLGLGAKLKRKIRKNYKIGIAVLAHERPEYLKLCLDSLFRTKLYDYDITFLIQDDGSKDPEVREIINALRDPQYKIIRSFTKKGHNSWAGAFNKAIKKLLSLDSFDIVGTCDSDALFHPEWLDNSMKVFLWAKENHRHHKLIKFSPFNSVDYEFHKVLGIYKSPFGKYVIKERMGDLCSFYVREDLLKIGFYAESKDDETIMTEKFKKMRLRNFCTETSYVEHIGEDSVLNQWRPVAVKRATFGINLAKGNWGVDMEKLRPYGYYRFLKGENSFGEKINQKSNLKVDVIIPAIKKDLDILPLTVKSVRKHLMHPIGKFYIVGPKDPAIMNFCKKQKCVFRDEDKILPIKISDVKKIGYKVGPWDRSGWIFQQLLKLNADKISSEKNIYVIDADTVLVSPQKFEKDGKIILLASDEYYFPYFETFKRIFGYGTLASFSFVAHQMLFDTDRLKELRFDMEKGGKNKKWYQVILNNLDLKEISSFSEYETYGNWMMKNHPEEISFEYWFNKPLSAKNSNKSRFNLARYSHYRSISFHSYSNNLGKFLSLVS